MLSDRKSVKASHSSSLVVPLTLGIILDGIPENTVIGLGILEGGSVSLAMMVAVFISNLPEAVAGTAGMRSGGWSGTKDLPALVRHRVGLRRGLMLRATQSLCRRFAGMAGLRADLCRRRHPDDAGQHHDP